MSARFWLASIGLVACTPAPAPKPVVAELVVPPIVDAGAPVVVSRPPPQPATKSAAEVEREDCQALLIHIVDIQFATAGIPPDQRAAMTDMVLHEFEQMNVCEMIDERTRACMMAAKVSADFTNCAGSAGLNQPPTTRSKRHP